MLALRVQKDLIDSRLHLIPHSDPKLPDLDRGFYKLEPRRQVELLSITKALIGWPETHTEGVLILASAVSNYFKLFTVKKVAEG
jgi:hypothetical protein